MTNITKQDYILYHIYNPNTDGSTVDPMTDGYIGYTTQENYGGRKGCHKSGSSSIAKYLTDDTVICKLVELNGTLDDILALERHYRPESKIGYNVHRGGGRTGRPQGATVSTGVKSYNTNNSLSDKKSAVAMYNSGVSAKEVAAMYGVTTQTLSNWKKGKVSGL